MNLQNKIFNLEQEFGLSWKEILVVFNEPDYLNSLLSLKARAKIFRLAPNTLKKEYRKHKIKIKSDPYPKLFPLRDLIWVKTAFTLEEFFKRFRKIYSEREIINYLGVPRQKVEYVVQFFKYGKRKIYNINRNRTMAERMI